MTSSDPLLFDASPLLHSAKADRLDVLGNLVRGSVSVTTRAVVEEVARNDAAAAAAVRAAGWMSAVDCDTLPMLAAFSRWGSRMGLSGDHNIGETTLCAYAECHGGTLVMDDRYARRVAENNGLAVRGTSGLVADACRRGDCTVANASVLLDALRETGMRLPFPRGGFERWARDEKLID